MFTDCDGNDSSRSQGTKRTLPNQNTNSNKIIKQTPKTQNKLKTFDSFDPPNKNKDFILMKTNTSFL